MIGRHRAGGSHAVHHRAQHVPLPCPTARLEHEQLEGPRVLAALRDDPATFGVPVVIHSIFVTAPDDMPEGLPRAEGYLPKPFQFAQLRTLVERFRPKGLLAGRTEPHRKGAWWPEAL